MTYVLSTKERYQACHKQMLRCIIAWIIYEGHTLVSILSRTTRSSPTAWSDQYRSHKISLHFYCTYMCYTCGDIHAYDINVFHYNAMIKKKIGDSVKCYSDHIIFFTPIQQWWNIWLIIALIEQISLYESICWLLTMGFAFQMELISILYCKRTYTQPAPDWCFRLVDKSVCLTMKTFCICRDTRVVTGRCSYKTVFAYTCVGNRIFLFKRNFWILKICFLQMWTDTSITKTFDQNQ